MTTSHGPFNDIVNKATNPYQDFEDSLLLPDKDSLAKEFEFGEPSGEPSRVEQMAERFSWKRTFLNCWTGWPNHGKTQFLTYMAYIKARSDNWKFGIWSPEMISSAKDPTTKKVRKNANDIFNDLAFSHLGKPPYKNFAERYQLERPELIEYMEAIDFISSRFIIFNPHDRRYKSLLDNFKFWHDKHDFDGWILDPFKSIKHETNERFDLYLDDMFADMKDFCIDTNSVMNIVAHPKAITKVKADDGAFTVCSQFDLSGGAAWNNGMDSIFSVYRPLVHQNVLDPNVEFYSLKMRKQHLVGKVGVVKSIKYDYTKNRYYFDGHCPIEGKLSLDFMTHGTTERQINNGQQSQLGFPGPGNPDIPF